jgi:hypothetical protein
MEELQKVVIELERCRLFAVQGVVRRPTDFIADHRRSFAITESSPDTWDAPTARSPWQPHDWLIVGRNCVVLDPISRDFRRF